MESIVAEERIKKALLKKVPPITVRLVLPGMEVLAYMEREKMWIGPALVQRVEGKTVYFKDGGGSVKRFSTTAVK